MTERGLDLVRDPAERAELRPVVDSIAEQSFERWLSRRTGDDNRVEHEFVVFGAAMRIAEAERLSLAGKAGLEPHWRDIAAYGEKNFPQAGAHFADVHHALVAAATGSDELETRLAQLEKRAADGKLAPGRAAIELCRGVKTFAEGYHDSAVGILEPLMGDLVRIGGSHAQRELWEDTLIAACLHSGSGGKAAGLIAARLDRRPSARDPAWLREAASKRD